VREAGERWLASRIDVADATRVRLRVDLERVLRLIGDRRVNELTPADVADLVAALVAGYKPSTIKKSREVLAMVLDHAGVDPNPARDRNVRLPRRERQELNPPTAGHVEAVFRALPQQHRLPYLWLEWSGARVSTVDSVRVGDYDERLRRVRLRASASKTGQALWVDLPPALAEAIEATLPARIAGREPSVTRRRRCSRAPTRPLYAARSLAPASRPGRRPSAPTTCGTGASASSTLRAAHGLRSPRSSVTRRRRSPPTPTRTSSPTRARSTWRRSSAGRACETCVGVRTSVRTSERPGLESPC
jgi:hypothetical protein